MTPDALDAAILSAHERGDGVALADLYERAGLWKARAGEAEAAAFFTVQAYIFALEVGAGNADRLRERLKEDGREA